MLKITPQKPDVSKHLLSKGRQIVITNVCNLNCGGCGQLIGHFNKDQLWFISLDELEKNIRSLEQHPPTDHKNIQITIFGGEPTLHPQWDDIVAVLKRHAPTVFWINTNGRLGHQRYHKEDNLVWWVDLHPESQRFVPTLHASQDVIKLKDDMAYWEKAQKDCELWKGCQSAIYKGKAYFCENAGAMDWLFYEGQHGWEIEDGKHPFERTKEEIDEQARHFCRRCAWCVTDIVGRQSIKEPSHVSSTNYEGIKKRHALPVVEPVRQYRWAEVAALSEIPSIGIYRLRGEVPEHIAEKIKQETAWPGVTKYEAEDKQQAVNEGRKKHEWTFVLEANQTIPDAAFAALAGWISRESLREKKRPHVSLPVYTIPAQLYDPKMTDVSAMTKIVIVGFHRDSTEVYDTGIFDRLGHRKETEGSGRPSLWHDKLTDVVGGVVSLS